MVAIRGWVYVLTNQSMPDLVKIGFSTKDPVLRAKELSGTGNPHAHVLAYDLLVKNPFEIEQRTHIRLNQHREGKEWFRCSIEQAIAAVRLEAGQEMILESVYFASDQAVIAAAENLRLADIRAEELRQDQQSTARLRRLCEFHERSYVARKEILKLLIDGLEKGQSRAFRTGKSILTCWWTPQEFALSPEVSEALKLQLSESDNQWQRASTRIKDEGFAPCVNLFCLALHEMRSQDTSVVCGSCQSEFLLPSKDNLESSGYTKNLTNRSAFVSLPDILTKEPWFFEKPKVFRY